MRKYKNQLTNDFIAKKRYEKNLISKRKRQERRRRINNEFLEAAKGDYEIRKARRQLKFNLSDNIAAPINLSFTNNTEQVIKFLKRIDSRYVSKRPTFLDFSEVQTLTHDTLVILLSICRKFRESDIPFDGNFSKRSDSVNKLLRESGFLEELFLRKQHNEDTYALRRRLIQLRANREVKAELSSNLISEAAKAIWGEPRRYRGVQTACIELMQNTNNHAAPGVQGGEFCWLSTKHYPEERRVSFTLLDFGVGVFESLKDKTAGSKWFGWLDKLRSKFQFEDNAQILSLIMNGDLHKTVTDKYYRGKGLPVLKKLVDRKQISNLVIITNNVRADVQNNKYVLMSNSFSGTFVYWEIGLENKSEPHIYTH